MKTNRNIIRAEKGYIHAAKTWGHSPKDRRGKSKAQRRLGKALVAAAKAEHGKE